MSASRQQKARYEAVHGPVPLGHHLHRVVPGYLGGTYDVDNLIALSPNDHALTHLLCYKLYGDHRDLTAYHAILEKRGISKLERSSLGGLTSGQFQNKEFQSAQGKKGGRVGLGDHIDMEKYSMSRIAGGQASAALYAKLGKGSFRKEWCPYCQREARLVELARWHKNARCVKPVRTNDPY